MTSLGENESPFCIFVSVPSGAVGLDTEVDVLPWQHVKNLQGEQTLSFADDLGEMGADCRLLFIITDLVGPSLWWGLDGNSLCMFRFCLE